jgi:Flp pilus assembly protein TadB
VLLLEHALVQRRADAVLAPVREQRRLGREAHAAHVAHERLGVEPERRQVDGGRLVCALIVVVVVVALVVVVVVALVVALLVAVVLVLCARAAILLSTGEEQSTAQHSKRARTQPRG